MGTTATLAGLALALLPALALGQVDVRVRDSGTGRELPLLRSADGRDWVAGEPGREYTLRLRNLSGERVLAVVSVDGVNVVTGATASTGQSGYVLEPWQEATIDGWRKSLDRVAAFYFAPLPESYAARTGRPDDVGVIGVAVFRERPPAPVAMAPAAPAAAERGRRESAADAAANAKSGAGAPLGTGHGRRIDSRTEWTAFERASDVPDSVVSIRYDSRRNLVALGVLPEPARPWREPRPFPGAFVPDPVR
jgi:hypothetical protein